MMGWQPEDNCTFDYFEEDEEAIPCFCTGRGKTRPHLRDIRIPVQAMMEPHPRYKRGRGRAHTLREKAAPKVGYIPKLEEDVCSEQSSLDSHSSPPDGAVPLGQTDNPFVQKWLSQVNKPSETIRFSEPGEVSTDLPLGLSSYHGSLRGVNSHHAAHNRPSLKTCLNLIDCVPMKQQSGSSNSGSKTQRKLRKMVKEKLKLEADMKYQNEVKGIPAKTEDWPKLDSINDITINTGVWPRVSTINGVTAGNINRPVNSNNRVLSDKCTNIKQKDVDNVTKNTVDNVSSDILENKHTLDTDTLKQQLLTNHCLVNYPSLTDNCLVIEQSTINELSVNEGSTTQQLLTNQCLVNYSSPTPLEQSTIDKCLLIEQSTINELSVNEGSTTDECSVKEQSDSATENHDTVNQDELNNIEGASSHSSEGVATTLVVENIPADCELTYLLDIMGSYGVVSDCHFNKDIGTANVVFSHRSACEWAQLCLDDNADFFSDEDHVLKAYVKEEEHVD